MYISKDGIYYEGDRQYSIVDGELVWNEEVAERVLTFDEKLTEIEERYEEKFISQEKLLIRTIASNHINQEAKVIIYQNSYNELADQKDLEILELLGGV